MTEPWRQYPLNCPAYERDCEKGNELKGKFDGYGNFGDPNEETTYAIGFTEDGQNLFTELLSEEQISAYISTIAESFGSLAVYQFFFNLQPGGSNRIYTRCMRKLLSSLQISPSFPILVGNSHVTAFGSKLIRSPIDASPQLHETWFSITSPRIWPTATANALAIEQRDGLFDSIPLPHMGLTILMWRMSVYIRYNHKDHTVVTLGLDEGGRFRETRLPDTMAQSVELHMRENPFSIHLLFLSEALHDWTLCFEALQREFKQEEAAVFENEHIDYAAKLRRFHLLSAHQLKYQKDVMAFPDILDGVEKEHNRFKVQVDMPDHIHQRVDENLYRLKQLAWSNQHHSSRMERQTKNIQDMLIHLITLENEISIRANTQTMQQNIHQMTALSAQNVAILRESKDLTSNMHNTLLETQKISDDSKILSGQNVAILRQSKDISSSMHAALLATQEISEKSRVLAAAMGETLNHSSEILGFMKIVAGESSNQSKEMMQIAQETREHSSTMKLVAVISMVFLPPTFICTFFSMQAFKFSLPDEDQQVTFSPGLWVPLASCVAVLLATLAVFYYPRVQKRIVGKEKSIDSSDEEVGALRSSHTTPRDGHVPGSFIASDGNTIVLQDLSSLNNVPVTEELVVVFDTVVEAGDPAASENTPEVTVEVTPSDVIIEKRPIEVIVAEPLISNNNISVPPSIEVDNLTNTSAGGPTEVVLDMPSFAPDISRDEHTSQIGLEVVVSDSHSPLPSPIPSPSLAPLELGSGKVNDMRDAASRRRRILGEGSGQARH